MKKNLLALVGSLLLTSAVADAATVYFENTKGWDAVYSYCWAPNDDQPFTQLEAVNIDGHTLYKRDAGTKTNVIFLNKSGWNESGKEQTGDINNFTDNGVYNGDCQLVATIVDGAYVAAGESTDPQPTEVELYLRGSFDNDWACLDQYKFEKQEDGTYTLKVTFLAAGTTFKVASPNWSNEFSYNESNIEAGKSYNLKKISGENSNMVVGSKLENVTIGLSNVDLDNNTCIMTVSEPNQELPEVIVKWFCGWNVDGTWTFGHEFEAQEGENEVYKVTVDVPDNDANAYFGVFQGINNTDFNDGSIRYTPLNAQDVVVNEDGIYKMQTGSNGCWVLKMPGTYTVVINAADQANSTISFDWGDSTGEANVLIDRVADEDHSYESFAMEVVEGKIGVYTTTLDLNEGDALKFNIHGEDYHYDPSVGTIKSYNASGLVVEYPLHENEDGDGDIVFNYSSTNVVFVIDILNQTATVTIPDAPVATLILTDGHSNSITPLVSTEEGVYTLTGFEVTESTMLDFRISGKRYAPQFPAVATQAEDADGAQVYTYPLVETDDETTAPVIPAEIVGAKGLILNLNKMEVSFSSDEDFTTTGIETVAIDANAPVEFFNLQGMRVANPAAGLYIRVQGKNVTKVLVK